MARDERVVLLGEDVGTTAACSAPPTASLDRFGDTRVFDTPISESAIVGASVGLSVAGLVPRRRDPVRRLHHAGVPPARRPARPLAVPQPQPVPLPGDRARAYGGGVRTPEHHSDSVEAPYTHTPGLKRRGAVERGRRQGPAHQRGAQRRPGARVRADPAATAPRDDVPDGEHLVALGRARDGARAGATRWSSRGARWSTSRWRPPTLVREQRGAHVGVIDLRTLAPLDVETHRARRRTCRARRRRARGAAHRGLRRRGGRHDPGRGLLLVGGTDPARRRRTTSARRRPLVEDWCRPDAARVVAALEASLDA